MRNLLICGAAALALAAGLAVAQDRPERPRPEGRDGGEERPRMERRPDGLVPILDLDKDGILSAEEIAAAPESLGRLDRDHDGAITPEELRATQRRERRPDGEPAGEGRGEGRERGRGGFLARYDANNDGVITREEYTTAVDEQFDRLDKNRDGQIDQEEAAAGGPAGRPGGQGRGRPEGGDRGPR